VTYIDKHTNLLDSGRNSFYYLSKIMIVLEWQKVLKSFDQNWDFFFVIFRFKFISFTNHYFFKEAEAVFEKRLAIILGTYLRQWVH
jgi:hypothetical protein